MHFFGFGVRENPLVRNGNPQPSQSFRCRNFLTDVLKILIIKLYFA
jgi:hypothetical protein